MNTSTLINSSVVVSSPPAGSRNIQIGTAVVGLGGRWIPCVSATDKGVFLSCIYEVGPGRNQVCLANRLSDSAKEALYFANELAKIAAA